MSCRAHGKTLGDGTVKGLLRALKSKKKPARTAIRGKPGDCADATALIRAIRTSRGVIPHRKLLERLQRRDAYR
jgi:hypothetical protein